MTKPIVEYLPAGSTDVVKVGRDALQWLEKHNRIGRDKWLEVGQGLAYGRAQHKSDQSFGKWCNENGYGTLDRRIRSDAMWFYENVSSVGIADTAITYNNPTHIRKQFRKNEKQKKRKAKKEHKEIPPSDFEKGWHEITHANFQDVEMDQGSVDVIITDPPYEKKYIPLYSDLAKFAKHTLKPGGLMVVMSGQSWLPQILYDMSQHIDYLWTAALLTPGGQAVQVFPRRVNTFWKPLLIFCNGKYDGYWYGDVCKSDVNDNDKKHHQWGQSESGMADIIDRFTNAGDLILDPCCGAGTTGVVAVGLHRHFAGIDCDEKAIQKTLERINAIV